MGDVSENISSDTPAGTPRSSLEQTPGQPGLLARRAVSSGAAADAWQLRSRYFRNVDLFPLISFGVVVALLLIFLLLLLFFDVPSFAIRSIIILSPRSWFLHPSLSATG